MYTRALITELQKSAEEYPIVTVTGPRQSGKSTLLRMAFPDYDSVSLEDMDMRRFALEDPRGFISRYPDRTIIDEIQRVPSLLSYLQTHTDKVGREGMYCLSGSQNIALMAAADQSLAGRTAVHKLLPLSHSELRDNGIMPPTLDDEIFTGGYPRIYDKGLSATKYYRNYFETYVERDVRNIQRIHDLDRFIRFTCLCAGRIGQILNLSSVANECGISNSAAQDWLSVLEASYIVFLLKPDYRNYTKRLVKSPKLYFYDTGLACYLLEITASTQLKNHYMRGELFENIVVAEFIKGAWNRGEETRLSYWRDSNGTEVDLIRNEDGRPTAYEIKSGETYSDNFFKNIRKWSAYSGEDAASCNVIYGGENSLPTKDGRLIAFRRDGNF